jgi:hypothetical protein
MLEELQCIREHKNKLLDHLLHDIESSVHMAKVDRDLFQQELNMKNTARVRRVKEVSKKIMIHTLIRRT